MQSKKIIVIALFLLMACQACKSPQSTSSSQNSEAEFNDKVLLTIGNTNIYANEFLHLYNKNRQIPSNAPSGKNASSVDEYMDLFVNFKLKVTEARNTGVDKTEAFKQEFKQYKEQLAEPYLTKTKVTDQFVKEAYNRMQTEVKASHILIRVPENASPEDTLKAYQKLMDIKKKCDSSEVTFSEMAAKHSEDPSAKNNKGNLGYFTAMKMVYPFEEAAYRISEGNISDPFRTRFGYHILKVHDKRPARGKVKVAHIMFRPEESNNKAIQAAKQEADSVYSNLMNGASWEKACAQHSDDPSTKQKGGALPYFSTGGMVDPIEEKAFAMKDSGEISKPVQTKYGWHILKLIDKKELEPLSELKSELEQKITRGPRGKAIEKTLIKRLKKEYNFQVDSTTKSLIIDSLANGLDNRILKNAILFRINDSSVEVSKFYNYLDDINLKDTSEAKIKNAYQNYVKKSLTNYEKQHLKDRYKEYRMLLSEYREGMLLFEIMEQKVWTKASKDSSGLREFYNKNKSNYQWDERIVSTVYKFNKNAPVAGLKQKLARYDTLMSDSVVKAHKNNFENLLSVNQGIYEKGDIPEKVSVLNHAPWETGIHNITEGNHKYLIKTYQKLPAGPKKLNEVKGKVISDYQDQLENKWLKELKSKHTIEINEEVLNKIKKHVKS